MYEIRTKIVLSVDSKSACDYRRQWSDFWPRVTLNQYTDYRGVKFQTLAVSSFTGRFCSNLANIYGAKEPPPHHHHQHQAADGRPNSRGRLRCGIGDGRCCGEDQMIATWEQLQSSVACVRECVYTMCTHHKRQQQQQQQQVEQTTRQSPANKTAMHALSVAAK